MVFFDTQSVTVGHCRCLPQPHRTCINGVSVMLCLLAKTMCGRTKLTMPRANPEEGAPAPWKITNAIGLYRNMQLDPSPLEKLDPWKSWTVLLHGILESYGLIIVFFEKAMINELTLQNKLRTLKKTKRKNIVRAFFSVSRAWTPPPPPTHTHRQT